MSSAPVLASPQGSVPSPVCRHPERATIDRALVRGAPYRGIAQQFKLPPDPVYRHMQAHLPQLLRNAAGLQDLIDGKRLLNELIDLHQLTMQLLAEARENDRPTVAPKAITVARGNIALMLKSVLPGRSAARTFVALTSCTGTR